MADEYDGHCEYRESDYRNGDFLGVYELGCRQRSQRKQMLMLCACCRRTWDHLKLDCNRKALEASEMFADGYIDQRILETAWRRIRFEPAAYTTWRTTAAGPAEQIADDVRGFKPKSPSQQTELRAFKEMMGENFWKNEERDLIAIGLDVYGYVFHPIAISPEWRTSATVALAESMYAARDFGPMPVLADALEEAGCDQPDILAHCRGPGPHVRGCWVVDLILGKS